MRTYLKRTGFVIMMTIVLVLISALCISFTAASKSYISRQEQEEYYREQERKYVKTLRGYLKDQGYPDSGVTLTRTTESNGTVTYTATIHHSRIDRLTQTEQEVLLDQLTQIPTPRSNASVYHELLVTVQP